MQTLIRETLLGHLHEVTALADGYAGGDFAGGTILSVLLSKNLHAIINDLGAFIANNTVKEMIARANFTDLNVNNFFISLRKAS